MEKITLKPNHKLMNPEFEGYKLSLDPVPLYKQDYENETLGIRLPNEEQYSYLHAKLLGSYNCIVSDPFYDENHIFVIDSKNECVFQGQDCSENGQNPEVAKVWATPEPPSDIDGSLCNGEYNPSISFPSSDKALFSDGRGMLYILKTGTRSNIGNQWGISFKDEVCGKKRGYSIVSSCMNENSLHCLLQYVDARENVLEGKDKDTMPKANFVNVIEWLTFVESDVSWTLDRVRKFVFYGGIDYIQLKPFQENNMQDSKSDDAYFLCVTEKTFELIYDSSGMMIEDENEKKVNEILKKEQPECKKPLFYWFQGVEDMVVWVMLPSDASKKDIKVILKPSEMSVSFRGKEIFGGKLWNILDGDSMTWTIQKGGKLEITFCKANVGMIWQRFLKQKDSGEIIDGEEVMDPSSVDQIHSMIESENAPKNGSSTMECDNDMVETNRLYNAQELEDCDDAPEEASNLYLFNSELDGKISHRANLSGRQWLFKIPSVKDDINQPAKFCLRHDVDGLIWQPNITVESKDTKAIKLGLDHVESFAALGYVQASKQQRKFTVCSSDMTYAVIIDRIRHLYIYRQPSDIAQGCELRNRTTGQRVKTVAKQQVITLQDTSEEIIGAFATSKTIFVSTKSSLFTARVCQ